MSYFNIVVETNDNTVVTTYVLFPNRSEAYLRESELKKEFIQLLTQQGYP